MDTFKLYVFSLTCITLIFVQTNVDATPGADCSANSTVCDASNNENCTGTTCVCDNGFYESGTLCASKSNLGDNCAEDVQCTSEFSICVDNTTCSCNDGYFDDGNNACSTNNALKPINLQSNTKTYNSVTLSWISPAAPDYTNSHVINYNELGGTVKTHNVNGQDTFTLIPSLKAGTTYTFTVVRSIIKDGRNQEVPASDPYTVTTNGVYSNSCTSVGSSTECGPGLVCMLGPENQCLCTTGNYFTGSSCAAKKLYGDMCTPGSTNECLTGLACDSDVNKCLCPLGSYYTTTCSSNNDLKPVNLQSNSKTYNSVSLTWTSPDAPGYTNSYDINYIGQGGDERTHTVNNQDQFTTVPNLNRGTTYTFTVVRSITRQGRKQAVPVSDSYPVTTYNALKPINLQSNTKTYNSVTLSWISPAAPDYTNSHVINYNELGGTVKTHNVNGQDTFTLIPSLKAGTTYTFTVVRSIIKDGRNQEVPASDPYTVTTNGVYSNSCTSVGSSTECGPGLVCMLGPENQCLCTTGNYFTGSSCAAKKLYGDMCTPGSTNECLTGLACDSDVNKCLCPLGSYYTTTCSSNNDLKPVNLQSNSKTYNSVSLTWTSPDAPGYTNSYDINYIGQGGDERTHTVNNQDQFTTVPNLNRGTTYTFTVVRSITRQGRKQAVPVSDSYPVTTYLIYLDSCTTVDSSTECGPGLVCVLGQENKCLCTSGNYFTGSNCISTDGLRPSISPIQPTSTSSVTVTWTSPSAAGYTNSFDIKYAEVGTSNFTTIPVSDVSTHTVTGLKAGTFYNFIVVRSITREERTQTGIESYGVLGASEKLDYGESCVSNGTCKNLNTDCYSSTCRCNPGYFWKDTLCFTNANLSPIGVVSETRSTTQLRVTWTASAFTDIVTGYKVELSPLVSSDNIVINGTSATISSLRPGERYGITVSSKSNYLDRGETAAAGVVFGIAKPAAIIDLAPSTSLMEPTAQIYFYKAKGRADTYTVTLTGVGSNIVENPSGPEDVLSTNFSGVSAGSYYNLTIITTRYGVSSDPFSRTIRVRGEGPEAVVDLKVFDPTSRAASVSWKRPINTKGVLYKYTIEVFNSYKCLQRINIQCRECLQAMNVHSSTEISCERETNTSIIESDLNNVNFLVRYDLSLLPDTLYTVVVTAYNEEGKGDTVQDTVYTQQEASGDPTNFRYVSKTYESIELTWTPPEPRPGVTVYMISVYEWDEVRNQYGSFKNVSNLGFYNVSINVTGLSSYWKYRFEMYARTFKGDSNTSNVLEVTTAESAPTAVENLEHQPVDGVYNQYQLSWRCPLQKDGRNGVIRSATVITSRFIQSGNVKQEIREYNYENSDCNWSEPITVTAEFNYTFEVYISNSIKGESTTIQRYMPAGPPSFLVSERPIIQVRSGTETEKTVGLLVCTTCLLDNTNGLIVKSGVLVCAKGDCPIRNADEVMTADSFDKSPNWDTTAGVSFSTWYRATEDDWLKGKEASDEIRFVLGEESCGVQDQNRFCNGPLPVDRTYRVWLFACTRVSCTEGDHVEFTLGINNADSLSGSIIAGIVIAAVLVVLAAVILVVYIKVIRPRSQRKRSTQYVSDTSPKDDTYAEIGDENRMSVIKDGQPEVDYYNTTDSPPRSEDTYDQLKVYSNQGQHDYGKIKVTQT